jgi:RNase P protein component
MTNIDHGRKFDLEELYNDREKSKNAYERDQIDRRINKIMREADLYYEDRKDLIKAVRSGDLKSINYFQHKINKRKQDMTYGHDIS